MGSRFERDVIFHVNLEWIPFDHQVALGGGRRDVDKCICHWPTPIVDVWLITPQRSRWFLVNTLALQCSALARHVWHCTAQWSGGCQIWILALFGDSGRRGGKKIRPQILYSHCLLIIDGQCLNDYSSKIEMIPREYIGTALHCTVVNFSCQRK